MHYQLTLLIYLTVLNYDSSCVDDICTATVYSYQRYYEEDGSWKAIDENFGSKNCGEYDYCVDGNVHQFYLSKDSLNADYSKDATAISFGLYQLFGLSSANFSKDIVIEGSLATYKDIISGVDLEYQYLPNQIKETIIVRDKNVLETLSQYAATTKVSFKLDDSYVYEDNDKGFTVMKNSVAVGSLEELLVYDANSKLVDIFPYTLVSDDTGLFLDVELDLDVLLGEDVAYPLFIDPTFTFSGGPAFDIHIERNTNNSAIVNYTRFSGRALTVGPTKLCSIPATNKTNRAVLEFNLSSLSSSSSLLNVTLNLTITSTSPNINIKNITLYGMEHDNFFYVADDNVTNSHYFNDMGNGTFYGDFNSTSADIGTTRNVPIHANAHQKILNFFGNSTGYWGIGLKNNNDVGCITGNLQIGSSTAVNVTTRPVLILVYTNSSNETDADNAIVQGIVNVIPNAVVHDEQQVYIRLANGTQQLGRYDKFAVNGSKRWAFNYITSGEQFTNMQNVTPVFYVLEMIDIEVSQIVTTVQGFINGTL